MTVQSKPLPVLIVDDDISGSEALCGHLFFRGYRATAIPSGKDALTYLMSLPKAERPCIILLDVLMPGLNGCEVLQQLRSHAETRDIPVIMLSILSRDEIQDQINANCDGANGYVCKPFDMDKLIRELEALVRG